MHNRPVLIILAAVVALIVIVVVTGMRYLRADDDRDLDFEDEAQASPGRSRSRADHLGRDRDRPARRDEPAPRRRDDTGAGRTASRLAPERAGTGPGSPRRADPAGARSVRSGRIGNEPPSGELVLASPRSARSADGRAAGRGPRGGDGRHGRASGLDAR
jgi:hypothetical protein